MNPALPADDAPRFSPGSIVRARGREWIVLSGSTPDVLRVRPVPDSDDFPPDDFGGGGTGGDDDIPF